MALYCVSKDSNSLKIRGMKIKTNGGVKDEWAAK